MNGGGAGVTRAGIGADNPLTVQSGAQPVVSTWRSTTSAMEAWNNTSMASGSPASSSSQLRALGRLADPGVAVTFAEGPADAVEQGAVGAVAIDVGRRQSGHGSGAAIGILPQGDGGPSGKGHQRCGSTTSTR